ncbi:oxygenase MpaB family protein [Larsenimonas rhizosphaerae]|uniref:Oxygenase MpaB family protein n=1 Tax=Larsenimonas rhizosphaerae TaxID=2944682 RepID=A0AA41ZLP5_9GAMM|nr:oxygenase MpaB family protein [Larsenimonas rhizosphaerae]MCX2524426.1 oxygenase MpaB family protein [Larsenimonas rhizosphaerae]
MVRRLIEQRIHGLTGLSLGGVDYATPPGDPGLFGPDSMVWRVHGDFTAMLCGGISALLLQMMHPLALAGVWDHSSFREDMLGRLRRTSQFIAVTSFGPTAAADRLIDRVIVIHRQVQGHYTDGRFYRADDPALLTWVHVAEARSFLTACLRYYRKHLTREEQDRYYRESALTAYRLGAVDVPETAEAIDAYLERMRPALVVDERTHDVVRLLFESRAQFGAVGLGYNLFLWAGVDLLPVWAQQTLGIAPGPWKQAMVRGGIRGVAPVLRWAVQDGARARAEARVAQGPHGPAA